MRLLKYIRGRNLLLLINYLRGSRDGQRRPENRLRILNHGADYIWIGNNLPLRLNKPWRTPVISLYLHLMIGTQYYWCTDGIRLDIANKINWPVSIKLLLRDHSYVGMVGWSSLNNFREYVFIFKLPTRFDYIQNWSFLISKSMGVLIWSKFNLSTALGTLRTHRTWFCSETVYRISQRRLVISIWTLYLILWFLFIRFAV
jgi:hypothetical protein